MACAAFATSVLFSECKVVVCSHKEARMVRCESRKGITTSFKVACWEAMTPEEQFRTRDWQAHHIMPIFLGGKNEWGNLALVEPRTHKWLHEVIDEQLGCYHPYDQKWVRIPYLIGRVWEL